MSLEIDTSGGRRWEHGPGLALVGYRGTGKSTVGAILANRLNRAFVDADQEIELRAGRTISSIFAESGEAAFRDWEARTLREVVEAHPRAVLATGGGAVILAENRRLLRGFGHIVWLRADARELARRLAADPRSGSRPALTSAGTIAEIGQVLAARAAWYQEVADATIDTDALSPAEIAARVLEVFPG